MAQKDTDWIQKEKRDMLFRYVNGGKINNPDYKIDDLLEEGKEVVDKIFTLYPDTPIVPEGGSVAPTQFQVRNDLDIK